MSLQKIPQASSSPTHGNQAATEIQQPLRPVCSFHTEYFTSTTSAISHHLQLLLDLADSSVPAWMERLQQSPSHQESFPLREPCFKACSGDGQGHIFTPPLLSATEITTFEACLSRCSSTSQLNLCLLPNFQEPKDLWLAQQPLGDLGLLHTRSCYHQLIHHHPFGWEQRC